MDPVLERLREICNALPGVHERISHGTPAFFTGEKGRQFAAYAPYHHGDKHLTVWLAAPPGAQEMLIASDPKSIFRPPYVGPSGWIGVRLDVDLPWDEVEGFVKEAYDFIVSKQRTKK